MTEKTEFTKEEMMNIISRERTLLALEHAIHVAKSQGYAEQHIFVYPLLALQRELIGPQPTPEEQKKEPEASTYDGE